VPQVIQINRRIGGAAAVPTTLAAGELALSGPDATLYAGVDAGGTVTPLVSPARQLEIHTNSPAQTVAGGVKTIPLALLRIPGGVAGEVLSITNAAGDLDWIPAAAATQVFVGSFDAAAGTIQWTTASGGAGNNLPAAALANTGWYLICNEPGSTVGTGFPFAGPFNVGDWVLSNGTAWTYLDFGGVAVSTADQVGVAPPVEGGNNVQTALEGLEANKVGKDGGADGIMTGLLTLSGNPVTANHAVNKAYADLRVVGPATSTVDGIMTFADATGKLAADSGVLLADLATAADLALKADIAYVDTENDAQDVIINGKADTTYVDAQNAFDVKIAGGAGAIMTGLLTLSGAPVAANHAATRAYADTKGDVFGPAAAVVDRIAVYSDVTGKLIADGGFTIQEIKDYVDTGIGNIPGATPPDTQAPEMIGDGTAAAPITFTGIVIAANSATSFTGNGSTPPYGGGALDLVLVDGGTY
jgi:hypothetical protein